MAGGVSTIAGLGGGSLLILGLSALWDPYSALAATSPALAMGNFHRASLFRRDVDWAVVRALVTGGVPGSLVGGWVAVHLPPRLLVGMMAAACLLAVARAGGRSEWRPPRAAFLPVGFVVGVVTAGAGGAGLLLAPLLLASGLKGTAYVGTGACVAVSLHLGRLVAYGAAGVVTGPLMAWALAIGVCITLGNLVGARVRKRLSPRASAAVELGAVLTAALFTVGALIG
jgi:uncharacterized protein